MGNTPCGLEPVLRAISPVGLSVRSHASRIGIAAGTGAGLGPDSGTLIDSDSFWLGASSEAAAYLGLAGRTPEELRTYLRLLVRTVPYGAANECALVDEGELSVEGYLTLYRHWTGCAGLETQALWDVYGVSRSGDVVMSALLVTITLTEAEARELLASWALAPEYFPTGPAFKRDQLGEYPRPPWFERPSSSNPGSIAFP